MHNAHARTHTHTYTVQLQVFEVENFCDFCESKWNHESFTNNLTLIQSLR